MANVKLVPLEQADRNQFILDNQKAFRYGAMEEFGLRDDHFEEEGEIISRQTIEASIDGGTAYRIIHNGEKVGGVYFLVKPEYVAEFESLTDSYIIEYCRAFMDQVDNDRILTIIATQLETFIVPKPPEAPDHG